MVNVSNGLPKNYLEISVSGKDALDVVPGSTVGLSEDDIAAGVTLKIGKEVQGTDVG